MRAESVIACLCLSGTLVLSGCSLAPVYQVPPVNLAGDKWDDSLWQPAHPTDDQSHGNWWLLFNDPVLNALEDQIDQSSPALYAALARYDAASAYVRQLQAAQGPTLDGAVSLTNNRQSKNRPLRGANQPDVYDADTAGLNAGYLFDIWGQVRNQVASGLAGAQASRADMETVRLSLHALLADNYVSLRSVDEQIRIVGDAVSTYTLALELTTRRHDGGVASGIDVARAQTQLSSVRAETAGLLGQRALYAHAIASLIGQPPMAFHIPASIGNLVVPAIPQTLPSELLLRRPDIAAAERRAAAANAQIGVARAAYYPNLTLGIGYGVQNTGSAGLFSAPNTFWSLGPAALLNLFDSGKHDAQLVQARATLEEASAEYRSKVLTAFQQVEDNLALLKYNQQGALDQQQALQSAESTMNLALNRYREGAVNYLEVVTAQEAALTAARRALEIHTQQLRSSVDLIRAIGGGWRYSTMKGNNAN